MVFQALVEIWNGYVLSGSSDTTIVQWGMTDCRQVAKFSNHTGSVQVLIASIDGFLYSGSVDATV